MPRDWVRKHILHLIDMEDDLDAVTTIDRKAEIDPQAVDMTQADVDAIWGSVLKLYRSGTHPAISLCLRRRGKVVLSRSIGHVRGNGPHDSPDADKVLATPDTPYCQYSGSKGVTAMLIQMLAEDGLICLMDPVSFYAPEFAKNGKENITIHQILAHRGGIPGLPPKTNLSALWDEDNVWDMLCEARPITTDGSKLAYHAITGGFVLGRVLRNVTGEDMNAYIDRKLRQPMGFKYFTYGVESHNLDHLAQSYVTGPSPGPVVNHFVKRALGSDMRSLEPTLNDPRFQQVQMPAANLAASAPEMSAFYQMMLNGGRWKRRRICSDSTVARTTHEYGSRSIDKTLMMPLRYSAGLMLGDAPFGLWGPDSSSAYGHGGLANKLTWADPERDISVALLNSGLPLIGPHLGDLFGFLRTVGQRCTKVGDPSPFALSQA